MSEIDFADPEFQASPSTRPPKAFLLATDTKSRLTSWKRDGLSLALLLALSLLFFWRVPLLGYVLLPLDNLYTYEPWRSEIHGANAIPLWNSATTDGVRAYYPLAKLIKESWLQGEIPFWNPYALTGMPILAAGTYQALYPIANLLRLSMPVAQAISWSLILHFFLGSAFTFLFLRELGVKQLGALIAAIAFVFNSQIMIWLTFPSVVETMFWFPLILWSIERTIRRNNWRWLWLGVLATAMQVLAGQLQIVLYSGTGAAFYALYRAGAAWWQTREIGHLLKPLIYTVLTFGFGFLLTAFQILPALELATQGARADRLYDFTPVLLALFRLLVPDIFGTQIDGVITYGYKQVLVLYFGLFPLLLIPVALFSPQRKFGWGLFGSGLLVLLVVYQVPPFHQLFSLLYPTYDILGFERAQFLTAFFWAAAAGLGADWLFSMRPQKFLGLLLKVGWSCWGLGLFVTLTWAFLLKYQTRHFWSLPALSDAIPPEYRLGSLIFALTFLGVALVLLKAWQSKQLIAPMFGSLMIVTVVADLFLANIDYIPAFPSHLLYPSTPSLSYLQKLAADETEPYRIMGLGQVLWSDIAGVFHLPDVQGYDSFITRRYSEYINASGVRGDTNYRIVAFNAQTHPLLDALNTKYIYAPRKILAGGEWVSLATEISSPQVQAPEGQPWAGQLTEWTIEGWTQTVVLAPTSSKITYQGMLPYPATLETAIALDPAASVDLTGEVYFELLVSTPEDPEGKLLFSEALHPDSFQAESDWRPVTVDLSEFAGQPINLTLATSGASGILAGWADPLLADNRKFELLYYGPNSIYLNRNHLPRAWFVHQVIEAPAGDYSSVVSHLTDPAFTPARQAVVETSAPFPDDLGSAGKNDSIDFITVTPSQVELVVKQDTPGLLVLADAYYPGWTVTINDKAAQLYPTNLVMRGLYLPAGEHQVKFVYRSKPFELGLWVSGFTVLFITGVYCVDWWYRRHRSFLS